MTSSRLAQGPDVLEGLPYEDFVSRLSHFRGEIKGILTRGRVISGIGNAYADEVLFAAGVYPYRKRSSLTDQELRRIHRSSKEVVEQAFTVLRARMGSKIHVKIRDFIQVHNKGGTPCPRCGGNISQITANRRITSFCRRCQPGFLIRGYGLDPRGVCAGRSYLRRHPPTWRGALHKKWRGRANCPSTSSGRTGGL